MKLMWDWFVIEQGNNLLNLKLRSKWLLNKYEGIIFGWIQLWIKKDIDAYSNKCEMKFIVRANELNSNK
jgi:hypothetical protein